MPNWYLGAEEKWQACNRLTFVKDEAHILILTTHRSPWFVAYARMRPLTYKELKNENGYALGFLSSGDEWSFDQSSGTFETEFQTMDNISKSDLTKFENTWHKSEETGVMRLGWKCIKRQFILSGPLILENGITHQKFDWRGPRKSENKGKNTSKSTAVESNRPANSREEKLQALRSNQDRSAWFPKSVNPVRTGTYQAIHRSAKDDIYQMNVFPAVWNGNSWNKKINKWRGLTESATDICYATY
jgi:hypothetical protein